MQPSEPTPAAPDVTDATAEAEPRSTESEESRSPNLWQRLFGNSRRPDEQEPKDSEPKTDAEASPTAPSTLTLTQAELERRVQAETDRREAKRLRDRTEFDRQERQKALERKLTPGTEDYDPYTGTEELARIKAEEQASQQVVGVLQTVQQHHDAATLDVLVEALPDAERTRILKLEGAGVGLEGRKLIVSEGLKALQKHWKAEGAKEAEAKLKGDPIFRKRVFTEHRGDTEEPELVPGGDASNGHDFMDMLQSDYQALKGRR